MYIIDSLALNSLANNTVIHSWKKFYLTPVLSLSVSIAFLSLGECWGMTGSLKRSTKSGNVPLNRPFRGYLFKVGELQPEDSIALFELS